MAGGCASVEATGNIRTIAAFPTAAAAARFRRRLAAIIRNTYRVDHSYAEALIGYYLRLGQLTAKAFAGASMSSEQHAKSDLKSKSDGTEYGAKGVLELWLNMGDDAWTSLDFSYATVATKHRRAGAPVGASSRGCRSDPSCATTKTLNWARASGTAAPVFSSAMSGPAVKYRWRAG